MKKSKKFSYESSTIEEIMMHQKCFDMKQKMWELLKKYYDKKVKELTYEEKMILLEGRKLINSIDVDEVIYEAYERQEKLEEVG